MLELTDVLLLISAEMTGLVISLLAGTTLTRMVLIWVNVGIKTLLQFPPVD